MRENLNRVDYIAFEIIEVPVQSATIVDQSPPCTAKKMIIEIYR